MRSVTEFFKAHEAELREAELVRLRALVEKKEEQINEGKSREAQLKSDIDTLKDDLRESKTLLTHNAEIMSFISQQQTE